jgi:diadenosine tetraphosphate (Ap4A) HIT family hydrolase
MLVISNEVRPDYFALTEKEKKSLDEAIAIARNIIENEHKPDGYNIGMNCGESAGQTVFHFHCHIIPRYIGDMENPRGGVRHCINGKGYY